MPRPSARPSGAVWRLLKAWSDEHPLRPNQTQMAGLFEVSESLVSNWKFMDSVLQADDILYIAEKTGLSREIVAAAAAEDLPNALRNVAARRGSSIGRKRRRAQDAVGEESQDPGE